MTDPLLFDAVLFDLDGTLVATDRFWLQAARTGTRRALEALGIERELPGREAWLGVIGQDIHVAFRALFPDLTAEQCARVVQACEEEEHRLIDAGGAAPMPGARALLEELAARDVRVGIASNCSADYLAHVLERLELGPLVEEACCLDTPGIETKADMLERHLIVFGTRSAVMVGDRLGDRDAAWRNGLPHVHCRFGFAGSERVEAQAAIDDLGELLPRLLGRTRWIEASLGRVVLGRGALREGSGGGVVGIDGASVAQPELFARDAARLLRARGRDALAVSLDAFLRSAPDAGGDELLDLYDLERLDRQLFEPLAAGDRLELPAGASLEPGEAPRVSADTLVLLAGDCLLAPRIHSRLARVIHLRVDEEALRRGGPTLRAEDVASGERRRWLHEHAARYDPERLADLVLDATNPLGPEGA